MKFNIDFEINRKKNTSYNDNNIKGDVSMKEAFISLLSGIGKTIGKVFKWILIIALILLAILIVNTTGVVHMLIS